VRVLSDLSISLSSLRRIRRSGPTPQPPSSLTSIHRAIQNQAPLYGEKVKWQLAAELLGVDLVDHVIVGRDSRVPRRDRGLGFEGSSRRRR